MKRSSSRNSRSRGFKGKHVLQICILLGVCFWLSYQVKHSHAKKEEFDNNDAKISARTQNGRGEVNLGRKSLQPRLKDEKHEEEDDNDESRLREKQVQDDKEEGGGGEGEEESKNDEDEKEEENDIEEEDREDGNNNKGEEKERGIDREEEEPEDETKSDDVAEDGRGGGDDEIDEHKIGDIIDHENYLLDEEKEREEIAEKEEGQVDHGASAEDHEAREKHYKADDASSAVTHNSKILSNEQANISSNTDSLNENRMADNLASDKIKSTSELQGVKTGEEDKSVFADMNKPQNQTVENNAESELNSTSTENTETAVKDVNSTTNSELDGSNNTAKLEVTAEVEQNSGSSTSTKQTENTAQDENSDKNTGLSTTDNTSENSVGQDQKDARIDMNTLPGNIAEGVNSGDTAAE